MTAAQNQIQADSILCLSKSIDCKLSEEATVASQKNEDVHRFSLFGWCHAHCFSYTCQKILKQFNVLKFSMPLDDQILLVLLCRLAMI